MKKNILILFILFGFSLIHSALFSQNIVITPEKETKRTIQPKENVTDLSDPKGSGKKIISVQTITQNGKNTKYYLTDSLDKLKAALKIRDSQIQSVTNFTNEKFIDEFKNKLNGTFAGISELIVITIKQP